MTNAVEIINNVFISLKSQYHCYSGKIKSYPVPTVKKKTYKNQRHNTKTCLAHVWIRVGGLGKNSLFLGKKIGFRGKFPYEDKI